MQDNELSNQDKELAEKDKGLPKPQFYGLLAAAVAMVICSAFVFAWIIGGPLFQREPTPVPPTATPQAVWARIQAAGKMVVGVSADYPPFEYVDQNFAAQGYDIALIQQLGQRLKIPLDVRNMAFDGLLNAIQLGQIDIAVSAISATAERNQYVDFSNVYFVGTDAVLAQASSTIQITKPQDMVLYRVGVQKGSVYETWIRQNLIDPGLMLPQNMVLYLNANDAVKALTATNPPIDLVMLDAQPADTATKNLPVKIIASNFNPQYLSIALPKGALDLQNILNQAISAMSQDGTLTALSQQYLNTSNVVPLPTAAPTSPPATPSTCLDGMAFVQDLTLPDYNMTNPPQVPPGSVLPKGWRIKNTGTCTWNSGYALTYVGSNPPNVPVGGNPVAIQGQVAPGQMYDIYVSIVAPGQPGTYQSFWSLRSPSGMYFGNKLWAGFKVISQATTTPAPSAPVISMFVASPYQIPLGQCTTLKWQYSGQSLAQTRIFRNGQVILQDMPLSGSYSDCPPTTGRIEYRLQVDSEAAGSAVASQFVDVIPVTQPTSTPQPTPEQPPVIDYFTADPTSIPLGNCVYLSWSFHGSSLAGAVLTRNGEPILSDLALTGSQQDCPPAAGQVEYSLKVSSEFAGTAEQKQFVNVTVPEPR